MLPSVPSPLRIALLATLPFALGACATSAPVSGTTMGAASLMTSDGQPAGTVTVRDRDGATFLTIDARNIPAGPHGFHLHETGTCDAPDFKSSGGHLNPTGETHGVLSPGGKHLGDLPNLMADADGTGSITVALPGMPDMLRAQIFDADGTAVIIHAEADDYRTDPTGAAGARIACGVLEAR
ncbi:MAG: superoxide dismutase family protein [Parerythrobacter sp.]